MIDVGEETGELDAMLMKIADNYDEEVDVAVGASLVAAAAHHGHRAGRDDRHDHHRDVPAAGRDDQRSNGDNRWDYDVERQEYTSDGLGYHVSAGSQFTIAHHLVGRNRMITTPGGDERETDGVIGPGLRRPALPNGYLSTPSTSYTPPESGRVYSAFLDLSDPKAFVTIPDSAGVESVVVVDAYGQPIRYFNFNDPTQPAKNLEHDPGGTNATFSERLLSVVTGPQYQGTYDFANEPETRPMGLRGQAFAVVSGGQDGRTGHWVQESVWGSAGSPYEDLDDEEVLASWREDNLVEVGS
jgi:hypothetical protein